MKDSRSEPSAVADDPNAVEVASVWIAGNGLHCSLKVGMYEGSTDVDERRAWGILIADIARHVSDGLFEIYGFDRAETLDMISDSFLAEVGSPTSGIRGGIIG